MKNILLIILITIVSCSKEFKREKTKLTKVQQDAYDSANLEFKTYMDDCLMDFGWKLCYSSYKSDGCNKQTGIGVGDIAVGTAIGRTASKILIGH